ncbi:type VII toxin-antitoxin system MntA family adenylyltransferase antitoxin [Spirosoma sp. KUDC1026]|uniref:type VII toxin-antitoxin system MntA family adenylyltransferase antitoxin n=1 Tax=Spirosoma sp. KUDC1026 TaxID=2745947 RepID=UPI00159B996A|nr:nucleotidyltransferase domain-containing protein [Spirosoma sp. KUDC1026]QKZ15069.1 nucleotidyltransferase domain-containing protein [Spirosoma sp. KUDC1026]
MFSELASYFQHQPVKRAYVFGSTARVEQTPESDIDILVELDYEDGADFYRFLDMQEQLSALLHKKVDLVSANGLSPFVKPYIDREKQLIYEKNA